MSCDLNTEREVIVLSASGIKFRSLGAAVENDLSSIEDRQNLGKVRISHPGDRNCRSEMTVDLRDKK